MSCFSPLFRNRCVYRWKRLMFTLRRIFFRNPLRRTATIRRKGKAPIVRVDIPDSPFVVPITPVELHTANRIHSYELTPIWSKTQMDEFLRNVEDDSPQAYKERASSTFATVQGGWDNFWPFPAVEEVNKAATSARSVVEKLDSKVDDFVSSIENLAAKTTDSIPEPGLVNNVLGDIRDLIGKLDSMVEVPKSEVVKDIYEKIAGSEYTAEVGKTLVFMVFLGSVIFACAEPSKTSIGLVTFTTGLALYFSRSFLLEFAAKCADTIPIFSTQPQAGFDMNDVLHSICSLLFSLNYKNWSLKTLPENIVNYLARFETIKRSLKDIVMYLIGLVEKILSSVSSVHLPAWAKFMDVTDPEVKLLFDRCDEIAQKFQNNAISLTKTNARLVQDLHRDLTKMLRELPQNANSAPIRDSLKSESQKVQKIMEIFRAAKLTDDGKRIEPVFAVFAGAPGNFKSQMIDFLCADLQSMTLPPEMMEEVKRDPYRYVFKREQANVYWDGYRDPHIVIFDDLGQFKTCVQNIDNEFSDIMKAVNELPLPLHMASVDAKGNTYFKARFILATTNFTHPSIENINSREAYDRRIAHAFYQVPKADFVTEETRNLGYMERKLNKQHPRLPRGPLDEIQVHPRIHSEFVEYDPKDPDRVIATHSYDQMVNLLVESYYEKERYFNQKMMELHVAMEDCLPAKMKKPLITSMLGNSPPIHLFHPERDDDNNSGEGPSHAGYLQMTTVQGGFDEDSEEEFYDVPIDPIVAVPPTLEKISREDNWIPSSCDSLEELCRLATVRKVTDSTPQFIVEDWIKRAVSIATANPKAIQQKIGLLKTLCYNEEFDDESVPTYLTRVLHACGVNVLPYFDPKYPVNSYYQFFDLEQFYMIRHSELLFLSKPLNLKEESIRLQKTWTDAWNVFKHKVYTTVYFGFRKTMLWIKENYQMIMIVLGLASVIPLGFGIKAGVDHFTKRETTIEREPAQPDEPVVIEDPLEEKKVRFSNQKGQPESEFRGFKCDRRYEGRVGKRNRKGTWWNPLTDGPEPHAESQMALDADKEAYDCASRVTSTSLVELMLRYPDGVTKRLGHGLILKDRTVLVPAHFYYLPLARFEDKLIASDAEMVLRFRSTTKDSLIEEFMPITDYLDEKKWIITEELTEYDQAIFVMPANSARKYRSILDRIATEQQHKECRVRSGFLMGFKGDKDILRTFQFAEYSDQVVHDKYLGQYCIPVVYSYYANTAPGDCGTPLYVHDRSTPKAKIFGMHIAGNTALGSGFSCPVVREILEKALSLVPQTCLIDSCFDDISLRQERSFMHNKFVDAHESIHTSNDPPNTKIIKSPLYEAWGPATTKPAYMRSCMVDGVKVDVKEFAYSKTAVGEIHVSHKIIDHIGLCYEADLEKVSTRDVNRRIYTFEEAILGLEDDTDYSSLSRNTSPGYPYVFDPAVKRTPGKRYWFGTEEQYDMDNARVKALKNECEQIIEKASRGIRSEHVFIDCLKDERRPIAKANAGKTRMINSGPFKYLIIMRMYFGAFQNWFMKNRIYNGSAIGVNPYSQDWDDLANVLNKFSKTIPTCEDGDYSGYDGSEKPVIHNAILDIMNRWYNDGPVNELIRTVLWAEVVNAKHLSGNLIYSAVMSLPSGHPLTALINTMYNAIAFRYCWYRANGNDLNCVSDFLTYVYCVMLGDDNVFTTHPDFCASFNNKNMVQWMSELGLTYTDAAKTGNMGDKRALSEVTFLKRRFVFEKTLGRYVAPLDIDVVKEIPYWTKQKDMLRITEDNLTTSLYELALHGKDLYTTLGKKMVDEASARLGRKIRFDAFSVQLPKVCGLQWEF